MGGRKCQSHPADGCRSKLVEGHSRQIRSVVNLEKRWGARKGTNWLEHLPRKASSELIV